MKSAIGFVLLLLFVFSVMMFCDGCATEPMTFEQQRALMGVAAGMQQFGQNMQANAYRSVPVYVIPQYNPAQSPVFNPVPITSANPYSVVR